MTDNQVNNLIKFQNEVRKQLSHSCMEVEGLQFIDDGWTARFSVKKISFQLFFDDGIELQELNPQTGNYNTVYAPLEWGEPYFSVMNGIISSAKYRAF